MVDNTKRFDGLADVYDLNRPDYPAAIMERLAAMVASIEGPRSCLDVGCGTGISTRALARALPGWAIVGLEPNADMLARATAASGALPAIRYLEGPAETLPTGDATLSLLTAAQALHWFDRPRFYDEVSRTLVPGGLLAILYNNRKTAESKALQSIEDALEGANPAYSRHYRDLPIADELRAWPAFRDVEVHEHTWIRQSTLDALVDYFLSRSFSKPVAEARGKEATRRLFLDAAAPHAENGMIAVPFVTVLTTARRR